MPLFMDGSYATTKGRDLIAKVLAGKCQMVYTGAKVGKGAIAEGQSPRNMDMPADYVMDCHLYSVSNPVGGECQVSVQINSANVEQGFFATGIILYARDPDLGEIPYTYLVMEEAPEYIRPNTSPVGKLAKFDLIAAVDSIDQVTVIIDPNAVMTYKEVDTLVKSSIKHKEITIPTTGWQTVVNAADATEKEPAGMYVDIDVFEALDKMIPELLIWNEYAATARTCELYNTCRTAFGKLRVYVKRAPQAEMKGTLTLYNALPPTDWDIPGDSGVIETPPAEVTPEGENTGQEA